MNGAADGEFLPLTSLLSGIDLCWAIEPNWGARAAAVLERMDAGAHLVAVSRWSGGRPGAAADAADGDSPDSDDARQVTREEAPAKKPYRLLDGVAYLHITGPMTKRPQSWGEGTSTILTRRALRQAVGDAEVRAILLVLDTPGGQVAGTHALAMDVAGASKQKPVACYCDDLCCSAGYWVASQAGYGVFCGPTATVGSIGALLVVEDASGSMRQRGVKLHVVATGDRKGIGVRGAEVTPEHVEYLRQYVGKIHAEFHGSVMAARGLSAAAEAEILRAGLHVGQEAVALGLCDGVLGLDELHGRLVALPPPLQGEGKRVVGELPPALPAPGAAVRDNGGRMNAREDRTRGENRAMRDKLIRALQSFKLPRMAVAVVEANDDSPEALAAAVSGQVEAEVAERVARHPLVMACVAAGIHEPADLGRVMDLGRLGNEWLKEMRDDARAQAIRAFGYEKGMVVGAQVNNMGLNEVRTMRDAWRAQADASFGIGADGTGAQRVTAPVKLNEAVVATAGAAEATPKSAWSQLTAQQQSYGVSLGMKTAEQQEAWAKEYLATVAGLASAGV